MSGSDFGALVLSELVAFGLITCRIAGFVVASPFPGAHVPRSQKVGLVLALSWFVASMRWAPAAVGARALLGAMGQQPEFAVDASLIPLVWSELGVGLLVGLVVRTALSAAEIAGEFISHATGLSSASVFDPFAGVESTVLSRVVTLFAMLVFVLSGAHRVAIGYLVSSFGSLPIGTVTHPENAALELAHVAASAVAIGLRLALPSVAASLVIQAALALVARVAPSLQIFNVGLGVLIAAGLHVFAASLGDMSTWFLEVSSAIPDTLDRVLGAIS
ncbi:MAG: flagellar biosynthetic protein FliR [Polyangiaceae bacterium]